MPVSQRDLGSDSLFPSSSLPQTVTSTPSRTVRPIRKAKRDGAEETQQAVHTEEEIDEMSRGFSPDPIENTAPDTSLTDDSEPVSESASDDVEVQKPKRRARGNKTLRSKGQPRTEAKEKGMPSFKARSRTRRKTSFTSDEEGNNRIQKKKPVEIVDLSNQDSDEDIEGLEQYLGHSVHHPIDVDRENPRKRKADFGQTTHPAKRPRRRQADSLVISRSKLSFLLDVHDEVKRKIKVIGEENGKEYRSILDTIRSESHQVESRVGFFSFFSPPG